MVPITLTLETLSFILELACFVDASIIIVTMIKVFQAISLWQVEAIKVLAVVFSVILTGLSLNYEEGTIRIWLKFIWDYIWTFGSSLALMVCCWITQFPIDNNVIASFLGLWCIHICTCHFSTDSLVLIFEIVS